MDDYCEINYDKNMEMLSAAVNYCRTGFSHQDIINELYNDNDLKKQICLIELLSVKNQQEADILVFNLTGHSGPVRESASYKILELIQKEEFNKFFQTKNILDTFIKSITDINPSVSRNAAEIIKYADDKKYIYTRLIEETEKILLTLDKTCQNRSYTSNKKNFGIFWNLEALSVMASSVKPDEKLIKLLEKTAASNDYTIREKTAKAAMLYNLSAILQLLENDENIYVRKYIKSAAGAADVF